MSNEDAAGAVENEIPPTCLNKIYCKSSEAMEELPDNSVHLMITSPPYNVAKEYDDDLSLDEYLDLLNAVWEETYRVLVPGGAGLCQRGESWTETIYSVTRLYHRRDAQYRLPDARGNHLEQGVRRRFIHSLG